MSLKGIAAETLTIISDGYYQASTGARVDLRDHIDRARADTALYTPTELQKLTAAPRATGCAAVVTVCNETTQSAARRLARDRSDVVLPNFASEKNAGGGFISGAMAQEEDLARCSSLYPCLREQPEYYNANRRDGTMLYTDYMIYSPGVPFFRERNRELIDEPFLASVITAPAPNAGEHLRLPQTRRRRSGREDVRMCLQRRAGYILAVAKHRRHRCIVLGAWGCSGANIRAFETRFASGLRPRARDA